MGKKIFDTSEAAAELFISTPKTTPAEKPATTPTKETPQQPETDSNISYKKEKKDRHLQLLLTKSNYDKLAKAAKAAEARSLNDFVNTFIEEHFK